MSAAENQGGALSKAPFFVRRFGLLRAKAASAAERNRRSWQGAAEAHAEATRKRDTRAACPFSNL
jgi:hypothetical protein